MKMEQLKTELHQFIDESEDEMLLQKLKRAFQNVHYKQDFWHDLTAAEQEDIELGLTEVEDKTNVVNHSVVMEEARKWKKK